MNIRIPEIFKKWLFYIHKEVAPQYFREVPSASINKNTWNIPVHYNWTSIRLKYHRSPPPSIFKWRYFPCGGVKVKRSSRINDGRHCQHAQLAAAAASPGVTFDFPPADCFEFFFLRWVLHVHSLSLVTCQDVHRCRVPGQLHRCTCTSQYSLFIFRETLPLHHLQTPHSWDVFFTTKNFSNDP